MRDRPPPEGKGARRPASRRNARKADPTNAVLHQAKPSGNPRPLRADPWIEAKWGYLVRESRRLQAGLCAVARLEEVWNLYLLYGRTGRPGARVEAWRVLQSYAAWLALLERP